MSFEVLNSDTDCGFRYEITLFVSFFSLSILDSRWVWLIPHSSLLCSISHQFSLPSLNFFVFLTQVFLIVHNKRRKFRKLENIIGKIDHIDSELILANSTYSH